MDKDGAVQRCDNLCRGVVCEQWHLETVRPWGRR